MPIVKYRKKKIFLDTNKIKYCFVKLFQDKTEMQKAAYPNENGHDKVLGVHNGFTRLHYEKDGTTTVSNQTGQVFLNINDCGAGVVVHELMHAVLWAHKHSDTKEQYPIVIKDMEEEETILHNHSYAVIQFYQWYWKVVEKNEK